MDDFKNNGQIKNTISNNNSCNSVDKKDFFKLKKYFLKKKNFFNKKKKLILN